MRFPIGSQKRRDGSVGPNKPADPPWQEPRIEVHLKNLGAKFEAILGVSRLDKAN